MLAYSVPTSRTFNFCKMELNSRSSMERIGGRKSGLLGKENFLFGLKWITYIHLHAKE